MYDDQGRIEFAVTVREAEFTDADRALIAASFAAEHEPRGPHGLLLSEATEHQGEWVVDLPTRDFAQQALDRTRREYRKKYGDSAEADSLLWRVRRRDEVSE